MPLPFQQLRAAVEALDIDEVTEEVVHDSEEELVRINTEEQLLKKGEDSKGEKIKPAYSNAYKRIRIREGLETDHVSLNRTGKLYSTIGVRTANKGFVMQTSDPKAKYLVKRYSDSWLGIQRRYLGFVQDETINRIRKRFNLK